MTREPERLIITRDELTRKFLSSLSEVGQTSATLRRFGDLPAARKLLRRHRKREFQNMLGALHVASRTDPVRGLTIERSHPRSNKWNIVSGLM